MTEFSNEEWKISDNRFVAFLDIMGFKDLVARNSHEHVYELMGSLSKFKKGTQFFFKTNEGTFSTKLFTASFSDSIIVFSKDDTPDSLEMTILAAMYITAQAASLSIPIKGAMAHGMISVNQQEQIYFGQPLIDAYLLQEEVQYYGIVNHNSIDKYLYNLELEYDFPDITSIKTPLKSGQIQHTNLNWFNRIDPDDKSTPLDKKFDSILAQWKTKCSGAPRKYIDNTEAVFKILFPG